VTPVPFADLVREPSSLASVLLVLKAMAVHAMVRMTSNMIQRKTFFFYIAVGSRDTIAATGTLHKCIFHFQVNQTVSIAVSDLLFN